MALRLVRHMCGNETYTGLAIMLHARSLDG